MFNQDFQVAGVVVRPLLNCVERDGRRLHLRPKSMEVLALLAARPGQVATRDEVLAAVWPGVSVAEEGLTQCIAEIREALGDNVRQPSYIETVPKRGYRLIVRVEAIGDGEASAAPADAGTLVGPRSIRADAVGIGEPVDRRPARAGRPKAWLRPALAVPLAIALGGLGYVAIASALHNRNIRWAREIALPEIDRLVARDEWPAAFSLARRAERYIPGDPLLAEAFKDVAVRLGVRSVPAGASVYLRDYGGARPGDWELVGNTPIDDAGVSRGRKQYRIVKAGFDEVLGTTGTTFRMSQFPHGATLMVERALPRRGSTPAGMVWVDGGTITPQVFESPTLPAVHLAPFLMDALEVTNARYQAFVDAGGYRDRRYWKQPITRNGRPLSWEEAMAGFVDRTLRPGPATWENGHYLEGQHAYPVAGVSWFEAAAFAEFEGKQLPTVYEWNKAAGTLRFFRQGWDGAFMGGRPVAASSNFAGSGPLAGGTVPGMGPYGTEDLAGNVREWVWNAVGGRRAILGGAWNGSPLDFFVGWSLDPFDRAQANGLRLVRHAAGEAVPTAATAPVPEVPGQLAVSGFDPVDDDVFAALRQYYEYDVSPLQSKVENGSDTESVHFVRERVSFEAAYDGDRVVAYVYLPKEIKPPYQAVIYYPGIDALATRSLGDYPYLEPALFTKSGRALVFPVYWGMFERGGGPEGLDRTPLQWGELIARDFKDLARTIDYLESRPDVDATKLGFYGLSLGADMGPIFGALEPRLRVVILASFSPSGGRPSFDWFNFAPRMKTPTLVLNGRYYEPCPGPCVEHMLALFGGSGDDKRLVLADSGYIAPLDGPAVGEIGRWLDRYLGPAR